MSKTQYNLSMLKESRQEIDYKIKFKTELCRNWGLGICKFGEKCIFAHGNHELRSSSSSNYKTKRCKQFHEQGYCQYGNRCQFKHRDLSQDTDTSSPINTPREQPVEIIKTRLPVFLNIAP